MSSIFKRSRLLLVAICCVAIGAGASVIAGAGASTTPAGHATASQGARAGRAHALRGRGGLRAIALRAVHADVIVHTKAGFVTVTIDRGVVDSVSGQQLQLTEGTRQAAYKTLTLSIPADARVRDNHQPASLSSLTPGQRVIVVTAPHRTFVAAHTPRAGKK